MGKTKWIHFSDLHLGNDFESETLLMRDELPEYIKSLNQVFDYAFCTGDIREWRSNCFETAVSYLRELCAAGETDINRLFVVPGNHDVDINDDLRTDLIKNIVDNKGTFRSPSQGRIHLENIKDLRTGEKLFLSFIDQLYASSPDRIKKYKEAPHFLIETEHFNIVHLDSTLTYGWCDRNHIRKNESNLFVGTKLIIDLLKKRNINKNTIILSHYPFHCLDQKERNMLERILSNYNVRLWFSGHEHESLIEIQRDKFYECNCGNVVFQDGARSCILTGEIDIDSGCGEITVHAWYEARGWEVYPFARIDSDNDRIYPINLNNIGGHNSLTGYEKHLAEIDYHETIKELYEAQNYDIKERGTYFIAEQNIGTIQLNVLVIPVYSTEHELTANDVDMILRVIQKEGKYSNIPYVHIVTQAVIKSEHNELISQHKSEIKVFDKQTIIDNFINITKHLQNQIDQYKESHIYAHYIDVHDVNTCEPLENTILDFIQQKEYNAFLILGDYGCGKTSFLMKMACDLSEDYLTGRTEYIPIYIQLRKFAKAIDIDNLIIDSFVNQAHILNFNITALRVLMKNKKILFLFDGFDEIAKRVNYDVKYDTFNQICQYCGDNSKVIVTCRPNYFLERKEYKNILQNSHLHFEPGVENQAVFDETFIDNLTPEQILCYIESFKEELKGHGLNVEDVESIIKDTHDLVDLSRRPFLLNIIITTLPRMLSELETARSDDKRITINAAKLYEFYTNRWLDREISKGKTLIKKADKLHFCKHLAFKLYKEDEQSIHYSELPIEIKEYFSDLHQMDEIDYFSHDIQSCSFMTSEDDGDGYFKFIHKSFMEYFVARYIVDLLQDRKTNKKRVTEEVLSARSISSEVALFIKDIIDIESKSLSTIKTNLQTATKSEDHYVRTNALSILSKTDENIAKYIHDSMSYMDGDFSHVVLTDRTICDVDFSRAVFYKANIENVQFQNCIFSETSFQRAHMRNVDFSNQFLVGSDFSYTYVQKCIFRGSVLADSKLNRSVLRNNDFRDSDMSGVETNETRFVNNKCDRVIGLPYEFE